MRKFLSLSTLTKFYQRNWIKARKFFVGTYDTPGVSHVGFYVGDGMLLHCGDPIQYTSLNTNYWQSHLYAYGRPPYN